MRALSGAHQMRARWQVPAAASYEQAVSMLAGELRALLVGLSISSEDGDLDKDIHYWMRRFDMDNDGTITYQEFSRELSA